MKTAYMQMMNGYEHGDRALRGNTLGCAAAELGVESERFSKWLFV